MKLTTRKIKQMIQEELENVLETRSFGGRPDGFMYPGEEEEKMRWCPCLVDAIDYLDIKCPIHDKEEE